MLRLIEYMDVGQSRAWQAADVVPADSMVRTVAAAFPLVAADPTPGAVARRYLYLDGAGELGVISAVCRPFCGGCTRIRLTADGKLYYLTPTLPERVEELAEAASGQRHRLGVASKGVKPYPFATDRTDEGFDGSGSTGAAMSGGAPDLNWLSAVSEASPDGLMVFRLSGAANGGTTVVMINAAARQWWDTHETDASGSRLRGKLDPAQDAVLWRLVESVGRTGWTQRLRIHQLSHVGNAVVDVTLARMGDQHVVAACREVTHLVNDEWLVAAAYEEAAAAQGTLRASLDAITDGLAVYDLEHKADTLEQARLVLMNASGAKALGHHSPDDLVGRDLRELFPKAPSTGLWGAIAEASRTQTIQTCRVREFDESGAWVGAWDNTISPVGHRRVAITWRDVTEDERKERTMAEANRAALFAATHDSLTGLANRTLLLQRVADELTPMACGAHFAVVYIDLDDFKRINDTYGHAAGDRVLRVVAARLSDLIRREDTAARLGGDEFVLVLHRLSAGWDADQFVRRARASLEEPVIVVDAELCPHASFGVVTPARLAGTAEEVLQEADRAMYQEKQARRRYRERLERPA